VSQCVHCQFYDRKSARASDARGLQWGLCRREPPQLNPVNAKMHTIEGVWPTVRDDDWCGQWQAQRRRNGEAAGVAPIAGKQPVTAAEIVAAARPQAAAHSPRVLPLQSGAAGMPAAHKPSPGQTLE
jgi:hypothetical protein